MDNLNGEKRVKMEEDPEVESQSKRQKIEPQEEAIVKVEANAPSESSDRVRILWLRTSATSRYFYRDYHTGGSFTYSAKIGTYTKKAGEFLLDFFSRSDFTRKSIVAQNPHAAEQSSLEKLTLSNRFNMFKLATEYPGDTKILRTLPIEDQTRIVVEGTLSVRDVMGELPQQNVIPITVVMENVG